MDKHKVENLIVKISLGWKVYKLETDEKVLEDIKKALQELKVVLDKIDI